MAVILCLLFAPLRISFERIKLGTCVCRTFCVHVLQQRVDLHSGGVRLILEDLRFFCQRLQLVRRGFLGGLVNRGHTSTITPAWGL